MSKSDNRRVLVRLMRGPHAGMTIIAGTTADMKKEVGIACPETLEGVCIEGCPLFEAGKGINVVLTHQDDRYVLYTEAA